MIPNDLRTAFRDDYPDENWDGECAGVCYYVCRKTGTVTRAYPSATAARMASVIVSTDPKAAPAGAFHFWSYFDRIEGVYKDWGHTGASLGNGWALMSNPEAWDDQWGIALGVTHVADWTARRRGIVTYLGWSHTYGENTANITIPAPTPTAPATPGAPLPILNGENAMPWIAIVAGTRFFLIVPQGNAKPRGIPLGSEGYRVPKVADEGFYAKLPAITFTAPDAIKGLKEAVDNVW